MSAGVVVLERCWGVWGSGHGSDDAFGAETKSVRGWRRKCRAAIRAKGTIMAVKF